jgi:hypothetical protein
MGLAPDIGLRGIILGIEGIEVLLQLCLSQIRSAHIGDAPGATAHLALQHNQLLLERSRGPGKSGRSSPPACRDFITNSMQMRFSVHTGH